MALTLQWEGLSSEWNSTKNRTKKGMELSSQWICFNSSLLPYLPGHSMKMSHVTSDLASVCMFQQFIATLIFQNTICKFLMSCQILHQCVYLNSSSLRSSSRTKYLSFSCHIRSVLERKLLCNEWLKQTRFHLTRCDSTCPFQQKVHRPGRAILCLQPLYVQFTYMYSWFT